MIYYLSSLLAGSSPRMRGTRIKVLHMAAHTRIIPADAGNTSRTIRHQTRTGDHPRGCGEHPEKSDGQGDTAGSSPRMRGTLVDYGVQFVVHGIIPADAGNTYKRGSDLRGDGDHPRGCGEHWTLWLMQSSSEGSSPRMRGTPRRLGAGDPY